MVEKKKKGAKFTTKIYMGTWDMARRKAQQLILRGERPIVMYDKKKEQWLIDLIAR